MTSISNSPSREKAILDYIIRTTVERGYSPSVREIGKAVGLSSSSSVQNHLEHLYKKGYIVKDPTRPRTITVNMKRCNATISNIDDIEPVEKVMKFPLVGTVAAGLPILSEENLEDYIDVPYNKELDDKTLFMLKVKGESMINAGILPGDKLIVEKRNTAEDGEIVIALVEDGREEGVTVKRFYKEDGHYRLQPENDTMEPIIVNEVMILGKVVGLMRSMN